MEGRGGAQCPAPEAPCVSETLQISDTKWGGGRVQCLAPETYCVSDTLPIWDITMEWGGGARCLAPPVPSPKKVLPVGNTANLRPHEGGRGGRTVPGP